MQNQAPVGTFDARYSDENAQATPWTDAVALLEQAGLFWVSTVRSDGRSHVTPVVAVWMDGALYSTSGRLSRSRKNLAANRHCAITTGCDTPRGIPLESLPKGGEMPGGRVSVR